MISIRVRKTSFMVVRYGILAAILLFVTWEFFAHSKVSKVHPSVHALCPLGGLESLLRFISGGGATLGKVFSGTMGLFFVSIGTGLLFKRSFCGNVCPLGTLQELTGNLGRKLLGAHRFTVPALPDRVLRFAKYLILALTVWMAWATGTLWVQTFDPWPAYSHLFSPAELFPGYAIGLAVLALSLVASIFYERIFCKYLCAMGATTGLIGLASPFKVRRDAEACIDCGLCDRACPANLKVSASKAVLDAECFSCGKCAAACPAPKALDLGFTAKLRFNPAAAVALGAGAFFLGLFVLQLAGFDRFSGWQEPTLRELAKSAGTTTTEMKVRYGLPSGLFDGTRSGALEKSIPLAKMAELNGMDAATLKETLGLDPGTSDDLAWGKAYGSVKLSRIAELSGTTVAEMKIRFGLKASVNEDTPWREVEKPVLGAAETQGNAEGGETECAGE